MKKNKKVIVGLVIGLMSISIVPIWAAVKPGAQFSVSLTCGNIEGSVRATGSNANVVSLSSNWCDRGNSITVTARAGSSGTATISLVGVDATDTNSLQDYSGKVISSTNVAVEQPTTPPSGGGNNNQPVTPPSNNQQPNNAENTNNTVETNESTIDLTLESLKVSEGKLSPDFASDKYEYTLSLKSDVTKLKVEAKAKDAKATIEGSKEYDVKAGKNEIKVIVSDGQGNSKTYTIIATVEEKIINSLTLGNDKIGILNDLSSADILEGFEDYKVKINKTEYNAKRSNLMDITLVYGLDSEGNKNYYIFDEKSKKITSIYKPIALLGNQYALITVPEDMKKMTGYKYTDIEIDGQKFKGWTFKDKEFKNYSLIYLMNDKGEKHLYQYESSMNRLQLFSGAAPITQEKYEEQLAKAEQQTLILMIVAGVSTLIAVVGIGSLIVFKKKMK